MENRSGCSVCGRPLIYAKDRTKRKCHYCGSAEISNAACENGHFVCDCCHSRLANDLIERVCRSSDSRTPLAMAVTLMRDCRVKMHGPEHHFLVPAVLLAAFANQTGRDPATRADRVTKARARAEQVPGGFCGFNGACGAAIGTGIFVSVVLCATPVSGPEWRLANLVTSETLRVIAEQGGPRCCKRDSFLALGEAWTFVRRELSADLPVEDSPH
ncbi:MAG: DUF5714 domain-containing protein [Spirochaetia bacterium]